MRETATDDRWVSKLSSMGKRHMASRRYAGFMSTKSAP